MARIHFEYHSPNERFAPGCMDSSIGKQWPFGVGGQQVGEGTLVAADVIDDGAAIAISMDVPDELLPSLHPELAFLMPPRDDISIGITGVSTFGSWDHLDG